MTVLDRTATRSRADIGAAYAWCRDYARSRATNFYYAFSVLPRHKRNAIYAAYAFSGLVDDVADELTDAAEAKSRLAAARASLAAACDGRAEEPVYVALADAIAHFSIPTAYFEELLEGVAMDVEGRRYQTWEELRLYCHRVASTVGLICTSIFSPREQEAARTYAVDLGIALQLVNIMRDVAEDAARGRVYFARSDLTACGLCEDDILACRKDERFVGLMQRYSDRARFHFLSGRRLLPLLDRRSRMCVNVLQGVYAELLARMELRNYDVFGERVRLRGREKLGLITRLCLQAALGGGE
jgi:phytoene synthase